MAKRGKRYSRRRKQTGKQCCPVIRVRCKATTPGAPKMCRVIVGRHASRKMNASAAGRYIGKVVRGQTKRRCRPLVKGSTS